MSPYTISADTPAIARELDAGERVVWAGQPDPARMQKRAFRYFPAMLFMLAFSLFWMGIATTPVRQSLAAGKTPDLFSICFPAFGLLFVGVAVAGVLSPFTERAKATRTFYALTDRRALVVVTGSATKVQSILPSEFSLERTESANGRGDLVLRSAVKDNDGDTKTVEVGFYGIENPREVERLAREMAAKP